MCMFIALFPRLLPGLQDPIQQVSWKQPARSELQDQHEQKDTGHTGLHLKFRFQNHLLVSDETAQIWASRSASASELETACSS